MTRSSSTKTKVRSEKLSPSLRARAIETLLGRVEPVARKKTGKKGTHSVEMPPVPELNGKSILSLDMGRRTGWAVVTADVEDSGVHELYDTKGFVKSFQDGERFSAFAKWLEAMDRGHGGFDVVAFEQVHPGTHTSSRQAQIYSGFRATLMSWAHVHGKIIMPIPVQTIKKAVTNNGNAKKEQVIEALRGVGYPVYDDNEADAIGILLTLFCLPFMISPQVTTEQSIDKPKRKTYTPKTRANASQKQNDTPKSRTPRGRSKRRNRGPEPLHAAAP